MPALARARALFAVAAMCLTAAAYGQAPAADPAEGSGALPILLPQATEEDLAKAWADLTAAQDKSDTKAGAAARLRLLEVKTELDASELEAYSVAMMRASSELRRQGDLQGAIELASTAVDLSPSFPYARLALAQAYAAGDLLSVGRVVSQLNAAGAKLLRDPRYRRPLLADLSTGLLVALLATAALTTALLFVRRARYFFHDFHHLFPKGAARWQSILGAGVLLLVPPSLQLGLLPMLLVLFAAAALYWTLRERLVVAALILLASLTPLVAQLITERTVFAGTPAEDVYRLERGGTELEPIIERVEARAKAEKATFPELFALGRYALRRGKIDDAQAQLKAALALKNAEPRAMVNLGNAMAAKGDLEGALGMYESAAKSDPNLAEAFINQSRIVERRAVRLLPEARPLELDRARVLLTTAKSLDVYLGARAEATAQEVRLNQALFSPPLPTRALLELTDGDERGKALRAQLSRRLLGGEAWYFAVYPAVLALALVGWGFARGGLSASKACNKCGRPVCVRCDPELGLGSEMCHQCVNVFARKGVVPAPEKVRKQIEVARYQSRRDKLTYLLGVLCTGAGHLFAGLPIRGALYAFGFLFLLALVLFRHGVLRTPYTDAPSWLQLTPIVLLLVVLLGASLRGLHKRQSG